MPCWPDSYLCEPLLTARLEQYIAALDLEIADQD
jgi:hypothetical protein